MSEEGAHRFRQVWSQGTEVSLAVGALQRPHTVPAHRALSGQHLVEDAAQRVDVGGDSEGLAAPLLGGHIEGGADDAMGQLGAAQGIGGWKLLIACR